MADVGGRARQGEKGTRFVHNLTEAMEIAVAGDEIEEIAMLAGGGIGPFAGGAGAVIAALQADIKAAARRVHRVAGDPVAARAGAVREVMAAHGLGIAREAARQIGGGADHGASRDQAAARALARSSGWRSKIAPSIAAPPLAPGPVTGRNSRRRQAMISEVRPSALSCGTAPSEKPVSSTRCAPMISDRRICCPPARSSTAPRSMTALQASSWERPGVPVTPRPS